MKTILTAVITALIVTALASGVTYFIMQKQIGQLQSDVAAIQNRQPLNGNLPSLNSDGQNNQTGQTTQPGDTTNKLNDQSGNTQQIGGNQQPGGDILDHAVFITSSTDPTNFPDVADPIFEKGSVPEILVLTQDSAAGEAGDVLLYFPSFENQGEAGSGSENMVLAKSTDGGTTWSDRQAITITDKPNEGGLVDPSVVQLDDGRIRMYYFGPYFAPGTAPSDPAKVEGDHAIYSIISDDGINFTGESGERFAAEKLTDPEVIYHQGRWLMYYSLGQITGIASSADGLTFEDTELSWSGGGIPGAYVDPADYVHLYGCKQNAIMTETSTDGVTFTGETETALTAVEETTICDPSPAQLEDNTILMTYKKVLTD